MKTLVASILALGLLFSNPSADAAGTSEGAKKGAIKRAENKKKAADALVAANKAVADAREASNKAAAAIVAATNALNAINVDGAVVGDELVDPNAGSWVGFPRAKEIVANGDQVTATFYGELPISYEFLQAQGGLISKQDNVNSSQVTFTAPKPGLYYISGYNVKQPGFIFGNMTSRVGGVASAFVEVK